MSEYELQEPAFELSCTGELTVTLDDLQNELTKNGYVVNLYAVGARGIPAKSLYNLLKDLGLSRSAVSSILERVPKAAQVGSYRIWLDREKNTSSEDDDFAFFGFHAKFNEEIEGPETCTIHEESNEMSEDDEKKWTVCIRNTDLRRKNTVYYWIHVMRHGMEYHKTGSWVVPAEYYPKLEALALQIRTTMQNIYEINYTNIEAAESSSPPEEAEVEETE